MDTTSTSALPPGQHRIDGFPRFGAHLHAPPPEIPAAPAIVVTGDAIAEPFSVPLADLARLPRREMTADFHCVSGWTATGLRWEGVAFAEFFRRVVEPALTPGAAVSHVGFGALDGYRSLAALEDALADDVLLAEHLDGRPLEGAHGAPVRLVSPRQYGFVSAKHLCRVELHTTAPVANYGYASALSRVFLRGPLFQRHPRARVWEEERHRYLAGRVLRPIYRAIIPPIRSLSARGAATKEDKR